MHRYNKHNKYQKYDPNRYARKHGLEKREESKGIGSKIKEHFSEKIEHYKQRNTPARRKERITNMALEAKEEHYKTVISKEKSARRSSALSGLTGFGISDSPARQSTRSSRSAARRTRPARPPRLEQQGSGLNDMFGLGNSNGARRSSRSREGSGLNDMFGL